MEEFVREAPGGPGTAPRWTSSRKSAVGTATANSSHVWFTLSHGIVNEVYYPRIDVAALRDAQFLVTADDFFSEEKRDTETELQALDPAAPAYRLRNTCRKGRYHLTKDIVTDPDRNVLLQRVQFAANSGQQQDYRLYVLVAPHIGNEGYGNTAWLAQQDGDSMLFAARGASFVAVACSTGFKERSVGFVGASDGWQDLSRHQHMTWHYDRASNGNVALTGEIALPADGRATIAIGFGRSMAEAAQQARASLLKGFDQCCGQFVEQWRASIGAVRDLSAASGDGGRLFRASTMVLLSHTDKQMPGATVASLAIPWGEIHGDKDLGGYHLVWARDLVEGALARLALDDTDRAWQTFLYLASIQQADGGWPQNNWLDGVAYWPGVQLDETALPIILAWHLREEAARRRFALWPVVRRAAAFVARTGPVTPEERWEEDGGYSPSTLAVSIAALVCAADLGRQAGEDAIAAYLEGVADWWASKLDSWTFTTDGDVLPDRSRYYQRLGIPGHRSASDPNGGTVTIRNRAPASRDAFPARDVVDTGFLELVRHGVRAPGDERVRSSLAVVDELLKVDLPCGPTWHRYNHDGYGEHADGYPFDGQGIGRVWPLLTGERAHYELAAGNRRGARRLARALECFANEGGLLPEQLWDSADVPEWELVRGRPSGSAMPLVWAHAEYVHLLRSLSDGQVFGVLAPVVQRYRSAVPARRSVWRFNHKVSALKAGEPLRIEVTAPVRVRWSADSWQTYRDDDAVASGIGLWYVDIPTSITAVPGIIEFTFYWTDDARWEGANFSVKVEPLAATAS